jgi:UPF0755 protein
MKLYLKIIFFIFIFLIIFLIIFENFGFKKQESDFFILKKGENILQVANNLKEQEYINSKTIFLINSLRERRFLNLKPGKYYLEEDISKNEILDILVKGVSLKEYITIVPGYTVEDVKYLMNEKGLIFEDIDYGKDYEFLKDKPEELSLEGYLFPDTYEIDINQGAEYFIRQVLDNFNYQLSDDLRKEIESQGKSVFDIVRMASILEKEVIGLEDKKIVAGILWKRLKNYMLLEVDSTYLYLDDLGDKNSNSFYNTYRYSGLPIGPICNPSYESILAAIFPKENQYWFYLNKESGETVFSETYEEHLINKYKYLK